MLVELMNSLQNERMTRLWLVGSVVLVSSSFANLFVYPVFCSFMEEKEMCLL